MNYIISSHQVSCNCAQMSTVFFLWKLTDLSKKIILKLYSFSKKVLKQGQTFIEYIKSFQTIFYFFLLIGKLDSFHFGVLFGPTKYIWPFGWVFFPNLGNIYQYFFSMWYFWIYKQGNKIGKSKSNCIIKVGKMSPINIMN